MIRTTITPPYEIKEIFPGHFFMMLDMLDLSDIHKFISPKYKYVWLYDLIVSGSVWENPVSNIFRLTDDDILIRDLRLECAVKTEQLHLMLNNLNSSLSLVQLNQLPPPYLKMDDNKLNDITKYRILNELDYFFHIHIPKPVDYGWIVSPNYSFLKDMSNILKVK